MDDLEGVEFASLLEAAPDAVVIAGPDGNILYVNGQTESMFGHARAALIGRPVEVLLPERFRGRHTMHRANFARHPSARPMGSGLALFGLRATGEEFPVEISLSPLQTASGTLVSASIRDVTERNRAQAQLDSLRRQQAQLLNSVTEGILGIDAQGGITFVNPAAARLLGYSVAELTGANEHELLHHRRPDGTPLPLAQCPIHRSLQDGGVHHASGEVFATKNGSALPVEYTVAPIREDGTLVGASVIFVDSSTRLQTEVAAREASIARPLARRILREIVEQADIQHQMLTQVGRKLATQTQGDSLAEHLLAYREMGLGAIDIEKIDGDRYAFTGKDLLERRAESRTATCSFTLGYLSEIVSHSHQGEPTLGTEIECQSRGAESCRFIVQVKRSEEGLARRVKELI